MSKWDAAKNAPLTDQEQRDRVLGEVEGFLKVDIQQPVYRGMYLKLNNALVAAPGPVAAGMVTMMKTLQSEYDEVSLHLTVDLENSLFWTNHALVVVQPKVFGRPRKQIDPKYREPLLKSSTPLTLRLEKQGHRWVIATMEGTLPEPQSP